METKFQEWAKVHAITGPELDKALINERVDIPDVRRWQAKAWNGAIEACRFAVIERAHDFDVEGNIEVPDKLVNAFLRAIKKLKQKED